MADIDNPGSGKAKRSTIPLPPELIQRILELVAQPNYSEQHRWRPIIKSSGVSRKTYEPPTDIRNARLTCKTFAALGAPFLLYTLQFPTDHIHLEDLKRFAGHEHFSKSVRTLEYFARWPIPHKDTSSLAIQETHLGDGQLNAGKEQDPRTDESAAAQNDIIRLRKALTRLTALNRVVFRIEIRDSYNYHSFRPTFYSLLEGVAGMSKCNVTAMDITVPVSLLQDETERPQQFATLCASLSRVRNFRLALTTDLERSESGAFQSQDDMDETSSDQTGAVGRMIDLVRSGAIGRLVESTSPSLTRLKLLLCPQGCRRSSASPWRFNAPIEAYIGRAAYNRDFWPSLRVIFLGCLDVTQDELVSFLLPRASTLEVVEFDRVMLTQGQWPVIGTMIERCTNWRVQKQHYLQQLEPKRSVVPLPENVKQAIADKVMLDGCDAGVVIREAESGRCYFEAKEESSTMCR